MSKFSVKKPFTVFVAVIAILVLGVVSYLKMTPDLLPNMDFPYIMIMTTYPGASPEKVEQEITKPLEQTMSTLENIRTVTSTSSENYSMLLLEFEESTDLDITGVDIQQSLTALQAGWDEMVGAPYVLKINPSMLPVAVAAVSMEGMSTVELTEFLDDTLMNKLEGISGVARISASGTIEQELHVILDQAKIDALNQKIAEKKHLIAVHRGTWHGNIIQNTIPAYQISLKMGADMVEADIVSSKDGVLFSFHDHHEPDVLLQNSKSQTYGTHRLTV